jgi:hypothetical protein
MAGNGAKRSAPGLWVAVACDIADSPAVWALLERMNAAARDVPGTVPGTGPGPDRDAYGITAVVGTLALLWGRVLVNRPDGDLRGIPDPMLEAWARWDGPRGAFANAFRDIMLRDGQIAEWADWNGRLQDYRAYERDRKAAWRTRQRGDSPGDVPGTVPGTGEGQGHDVPGQSRGLDGGRDDSIQGTEEVHTPASSAREPSGTIAGAQIDGDAGDESDRLAAIRALPGGRRALLDLRARVTADGKRADAYLAELAMVLEGGRSKMPGAADALRGVQEWLADASGGPLKLSNFSNYVQATATPRPAPAGPVVGTIRTNSRREAPADTFGGILNAIGGQHGRE